MDRIVVVLSEAPMIHVDLPHVMLRSQMIAKASLTFAAGGCLKLLPQACW
jgi:hypothetical protein